MVGFIRCQCTSSSHLTLYLQMQTLIKSCHVVGFRLTMCLQLVTSIDLLIHSLIPYFNRKSIHSQQIGSVPCASTTPPCKSSYLCQWFLCVTPPILVVSFNLVVAYYEFTLDKEYHATQSSKDISQPRKDVGSSFIRNSQPLA